MRVKLLEKKIIPEFLSHISEQYDTWCPVEDEWQEIHFLKIPGKDKKEFLNRLCCDYESLLNSPKTVAFPQIEPLLEFKQGQIKDLAQEARAKLFFGVRACDYKAMLFVDDFFKRDYEDKYYLNRMDRKIVVIIGCLKAPRDCFCTSTNTGPFLENGFDLQLVDIGDSYVVEIGSEKGSELIEQYKAYFEETKTEIIKTCQQVKQKAAESVKLCFDFQKALNAFSKNKVPEDIYKRISERCIHCGGCLYICPTCTCFNVFDRGDANKGFRFRNWDACVFAGYTREASGHNPRKDKWLRATRRYEHKLKYDYAVCGMSGCVGCGRCLAVCPVNIGISQVIEEVSKK